MTEFEKIKMEYVSLRNGQRNVIIEKLCTEKDYVKESVVKENETIEKTETDKGSKSIDLIVIDSGGQGRTYGKNRLTKTYNLQNWKWVEVVDDKHFQALISLNMPDVDPNSGNMHALYDRIGIRFTWFVKSKSGSRDDNQKKLLETSWIDTGFGLPLSDDNIKEIAKLIREGHNKIGGFISELEAHRESFEPKEPSK